MKKVTLFAVAGFGLLILCVLYNLFNTISQVINYDLPISNVITNILSLVGLVCVEIFFVLLYTKQK